jgi:hypothetical protein
MPSSLFPLRSHESERISGGLYGSGRGGSSGFVGSLEGPSAAPIKPLLSFVPNEGVTALAWKTNVPYLLVYGTVRRFYVDYV